MAVFSTLVRQWKTNGAGRRNAFSTSTTASAAAAGTNYKYKHHRAPAEGGGNGGLKVKGEVAPVYVVVGMIFAAVAVAAHTAKQQLFHSPGVQVSKKKRECMPEVETPHLVIHSAHNFINKSFLRKVAHIQDHHPTLPDPVPRNPFNRAREVETLESVGVEPA